MHNADETRACHWITALLTKGQKKVTNATCDSISAVAMGGHVISLFVIFIPKA